MQWFHYFANRQSKAMKASALLAKILILLILSSMANASQLYSYQERVIICMVPIEHADAEQLADTLAPFLSPQGKISAYSPTNTLIIKDNPSVVRMLIKVIKGREDLSECQNIQNGPEVNHQIPSD
jgi:type II secretory pathway component GspD/PulD (secretin)